MHREVLFALVLVFAMCGAAAAGETRATPQEARAMCERAVSSIRTAGATEAFVEIQRPGGPFHDRELFVVVMDTSGTVLAHGARPNYVGQNMSELTDVYGVPFVARMLSMREDGFLDYAWQNPLSGRIEPKRSWVAHAPGYVVFVGAYAPQGE